MAVPLSLRKWIKGYDKELDIAQDEPTGEATLLFRQRPVCVLMHPDGVPIKNLDLHAPLVRQIVRKCDQDVNGSRMTRFIVDRKLERYRANERKRQRVIADATEEARKRAHHKTYGPKPFVTGI